ncbi:MAG: hypothetical protein L6R28_24150 [Planctomycetes bacterium]|nr:hypothetical protein [Planctomycetota bacterium]
MDDETTPDSVAEIKVKAPASSDIFHSGIAGVFERLVWWTFLILVFFTGLCLAVGGHVGLFTATGGGWWLALFLGWVGDSIVLFFLACGLVRILGSKGRLGKFHRILGSWVGVFFSAFLGMIFLLAAVGIVGNILLFIWKAITSVFS